MTHSRWRLSAAHLTLTAAVAVLAGAGGATAGTLITGRDIRDGSITARDLAPKSVTPAKLSAASIAQLAGTPGTAWTAGEGEPGAADAGGRTDGLWYLDTLTDRVYSLSGGTWSFTVDIGGDTGPAGQAGPAGAAGAVGPAGPAGSTWTTSAGAPAVGSGSTGDLHLDTSTGTISERTAGGWVDRYTPSGGLGSLSVVSATNLAVQAGQNQIHAVACPAGSVAVGGAFSPANLGNELDPGNPAYGAGNVRVVAEGVGSYTSATAITFGGVPGVGGQWGYGVKIFNTGANNVEVRFNIYVYCA